MMKPRFTTLRLLMAVLLWAVGTNLPASAAEGHTPTPAPGALPLLSQRDNQAVMALLESAANDLNAGRLEHAASALERALRIEPGNATIWHYLGQTRLQQGNYQQAESLALKSTSLAGDDTALRARNAWLIGAARQAAGQQLTPTVTDGERQALQQRLDKEIERRRHAEAQAAALRERLEQEHRWQAETSKPVHHSPSQRGAASEPVPDEVDQESQEERFMMEETPWQDTREAPRGAGYDQDAMQIPPGHRPPPGQCRIWLPDRPPGHQPPPGDCWTLRQQVPPGAWLVGP